MFRRSIESINYDVVRILVALLLLTASALKCWQLATEPVLGTSLLESRWLLMATVEGELLLGLWLLLAGVWVKPTWAVAIACFGLFACVSFCKALSGHATCGCFGRVVVNPWYTTGLDLAVVASLLRWRPSFASPLSSGGEGKGEGNRPLLPITRRATAVVVIWLLIGVPAAIAMGSYTDTTVSEAGGVKKVSGTIVWSIDLFRLRSTLRPCTDSGNRSPAETSP